MSPKLTTFILTVASEQLLRRGGRAKPGRGTLRHGKGTEVQTLLRKGQEILQLRRVQNKVQEDHEEGQGGGKE